MTVGYQHPFPDLDAEEGNQPLQQISDSSGGGRLQAPPRPHLEESEEKGKIEERSSRCEIENEERERTFR